MIQFPTSNDLNIPLEDVLCRIEFADPMEIDEMIHAVQRRYSRVFPGWEVWFLSVHSEDENERRQQVALLIESLKRMYLE